MFMDSHLPGAACFILFILLEAVFFSFGAAIQNINTAELERKMEEGDIKAGQILRIVNRPTPFVNSIQITILLIGFTVGGILVPMYAGPLAARFHSLGIFAGPAAVFLVVLAAVVVMTAVGIVFPKRIAMRQPEKWARRCLGPVRFFMTLLLPVRLPVKILSRILMRLCGIDPDKKEENVTEEDIMSMVNEGHVQGVVEADEAPRALTLEPLENEQGLPRYCGEQLTWHKFEEDVTGTAFDSAVKQYYDNIYAHLTEGAPLVIQPRKIVQQIALIEEVHRQNPLPIRF